MKPVYVKWIDSSSLSNNWEDGEIAKDFIKDKCIIKQVGYILNEDDTYLLLVSRISSFTKSGTKGYGDVFKIPKVCILKRKVIS